MRAAPVLLLALLLALGWTAACRNAESSSEAFGAMQDRSSGPGPVVTGTVIDAGTGRPISGALVRGPGGAETHSDENGRFVLRGLKTGTTGELVGTTESGLHGRNLLRALEGGPLEVVLHLR